MQATYIASKQAHRINYPDGCRGLVYDDGRWDLTLPTGKHLRGQEADTAFAQAAVNEARDQWILKQWDTGTPSRFKHGAGWLVPLT
jgi:hypothetical protein